MGVRRNGEWVRSMRRRLGLNQRELAAGVGVSPSFIGEIETDDKPVSPKVETGILRLLSESGLGIVAVPRPEDAKARSLPGQESDNGAPTQPSLARGMGGDALEDVGPLSSGNDDLLRHVVLELTAHLRRVDENDRLRIQTVQAPEARAREAAESNIRTMLGMLASSQDPGRQGSDDGPPQGPTTGTDNT